MPSLCPAPSDTAAQWLSPHDVARELNVSVRTITRWLQLPQGRLLSVRVGSVTRIRRTTLEQWLKARERA